MSMSVYMVDGPQQGRVMEFPDGRGFSFLAQTPYAFTRLVDGRPAVFHETVNYATKRFTVRFRHSHALTVVKDDPFCQYGIEDVDWLAYCGKAEVLDAVATIHCYCAAVDWNACRGFRPNLQEMPTQVALDIPDAKPGWRLVSGNRAEIEAAMLRWIKAGPYINIHRFQFPATGVKPCRT